MTANKPMTGEQMDELMTVAVNFQRDSEKAGERSCANFAYAVQVAVLELRKVRADVLALAAENAALKSAFDQPQAYLSWHAIPPTWDEPLPCGEYLDAHAEAGHKNSDGTDCWPVFAKPEIETPSTDAFLAEVRAQGRSEGINFAASRLAAAYNHGFVDKPLTEVYDVVRMILDAKEELGNSTLPAADGLSGEYAEKFLEEFAAQLRQGAAQ